MNDYQNFSSLPPEEERQFAVFERQSVESGKSAWLYGLIAGGIFFVAAVAIVFSHTKPENKHAESFESDDLGSEAREVGSTPAPTPDTPKEEAPTEEAAPEGAAVEGAGGEGAAAEGAGGEGAAAEGAGATPEAPPPPKGATKAPPTALIK